MKGKSREERVLDRTKKCKHFNGIQHDTCDAGINYHELLGSGAGCFAHMPCFSDEQSTVECHKRQLYTLAESEAEEQEIEQSIEQFLGRMRRHECECGKSVDNYKQVGHCVYREPCGHRLGQGDAKVLNKSLAEYRTALAPADTKGEGL